jgi:hypothetical protein
MLLNKNEKGLTQYCERGYSQTAAAELLPSNIRQRASEHLFESHRGPSHDLPDEILPFKKEVISLRGFEFRLQF